MDDYIYLGAILGTVAYISAKRTFHHDASEVMAVVLSHFCFAFAFGMLICEMVSLHLGVKADPALSVAVSCFLALIATWAIKTAAPWVASKLLSTVKSFNVKLWLAKLFDLQDKNDGDRLP